MSSTTDAVAEAAAPDVAVPDARAPQTAAPDAVALPELPLARRERPAREGGHPAPGKSQSPQRGPAADCTADSAGGLTFDVRLPAGTGPGQDPALLLRRRPGASGDTETVRLPLAPVEDEEQVADGEQAEHADHAGANATPVVTLRAALPSTVPLSEGRWNVFLALDDQEPRRLAPGVNDLRSLVDRTPRESRTWLGVRIPYATKHGNLSVRAWLRWPHAEAGALRVMDGGLVLCGRLYGAEVTPTARLEARPRRGEARAVFAEVAAEGADFTTVLPYPPLAGHQLWDLWLRPGEGEAAIRVARILDDVPDKKRIFTYPAQRVEPLPEQDGGEAAHATAVTATPYYTLNNDLAVRIDRAPEPIEQADQEDGADRADREAVGDRREGGR